MDSFLHKAGRLSLFALGGLFLAGGSFLATSGDLAYSSTSLLSAVISALTPGPSISISRNPSSPGGTVIPGRSQTLAVFDLTPRNLTQYATIRSVPVQLSLTGTLAGFEARDFSIDYSYCLPTSASSTAYGYNGGYCSTTRAYPSSVVRDANSYRLMFTQTLPVYPNQTSANIVVKATPYYSVPDATQQKITYATVRVISPVIAESTKCRVIYYGYQNRYGYTKCTPSYPRVDVSLGYGNQLTVGRVYGYGYYNVTLAPGTQPPNMLLQASATLQPFTRFTLINNTSGPVAIDGVTIRQDGSTSRILYKTGLVDNFGRSYGYGYFGAYHQATTHTSFTLAPYEMKSLTVVANVVNDLSAFAGQMVKLALIHVNAGPVIYPVPIVGATHTVATTSPYVLGTSPSPQPTSRTVNAGETLVVFANINLVNNGTSAIHLNGLALYKWGASNNAFVNAGLRLMGGQMAMAEFNAIGYANIYIPIDLNPGQSIALSVVGNMVSSFGPDAGKQVALGINGILHNYGGALTFTGVLPNGTTHTLASSTDPSNLRSYPTVSQGTIPSDLLVNDNNRDLLRFRITANSSGSVGIGQFHITTVTNNATVTQPRVYAFIDPGYSVPVSQFPTGLLGTVPPNATLSLAYPLEIPAGQTYYFSVLGGVSNVRSDSYLITSLWGDAVFTDLAPFSSLQYSAFAWSPNTTSTSIFSDPDWTDGYNIGIDARNGISQRLTPSSTVPPLITASPTSGAAPLVVAFTATASIADNGYLSLDFGDGQSGGVGLVPGSCLPGYQGGVRCSYSVTHTYANGGNYTARLERGHGFEASATITVSSRQQPVVTSISPTNGPNGTPVTIRGTNFGSSNYINFVQGNTGYAVGYQTPSSNGGTTLSFPLSGPSNLVPGMYTVQVCNGGGTSNACSNSSVTFTVTGTTTIPTFTASPTSGTAPLAVDFRTSLSASDANIGTYNISYGDGASEYNVACPDHTSNPPTCITTTHHTYTSAGTYTAVLSRHLGGPSGPEQLVGSQTITVTGSFANCVLDGVTVLHASSRAFFSARTVPFGSTCASVSQTRTCTNGTLSGTYQYASCITLPPPPVLPSVTITATDASAGEAGLVTGSYTISRTGPTTQSLSVSVAVSGTATRDTDYILTQSGMGGGTRQIAIIPAGSATTNILLTPKQDTLHEPTETVVITLEDGANYNLAAPRSATVRITDND